MCGMTHSHADFQTNLLQRHSFHCNTRQYTATRCTTLQRTATHCNTLQHTQPRRLPDESVSARQSLRYTFSKSQSVTQFTALNYHRSDFSEISTTQKISGADGALAEAFFLNCWVGSIERVLTTVPTSDNDDSVLEALLSGVVTLLGALDRGRVAPGRISEKSA